MNRIYKQITVVAGALIFGIAILIYMRGDVVDSPISQNAVNQTVETDSLSSQEIPRHDNYKEQFPAPVNKALEWYLKTQRGSEEAEIVDYSEKTWSDECLEMYGEEEEAGKAPCGYKEVYGYVVWLLDSDFPQFRIGIHISNDGTIVGTWATVPEEYLDFTGQHIVRKK